MKVFGKGFRLDIEATGGGSGRSQQDGPEGLMRTRSPSAYSGTALYRRDRSGATGGIGSDTRGEGGQAERT
jgi:hypothetical protein